jgi:hypothetical protein
MVSNSFPLEQIHIASPCSAKWSDMEGDDKVRFCRECHKNVFNLSAMNPSEAESLLQDVESVRCVRLYRRADGTVITDDCPVGLRQTRKAICWMFGRLAAAIHITLIGVVGMEEVNCKADAMAALRKVEPFATVIKWFSPCSPPSSCTMGKR